MERPSIDIDSFPTQHPYDEMIHKKKRKKEKSQNGLNAYYKTNPKQRQDVAAYSKNVIDRKMPIMIVVSNCMMPCNFEMHQRGGDI